HLTDRLALRSFPTRRTSELVRLDGRRRAQRAAPAPPRPRPGPARRPLTGVPRRTRGCCRYPADNDSNPVLDREKGRARCETVPRSEEHTSELQSRETPVCRL